MFTTSEQLNVLLIYEPLSDKMEVQIALSSFIGYTLFNTYIITKAYLKPSIALPVSVLIKLTPSQLNLPTLALLFAKAVLKTNFYESFRTIRQ